MTGRVSASSNPEVEPGPAAAGMQIEGTIRANMIAAVNSARRWHGRPVHRDTLQYWGSLAEHARSTVCEADPESLGALLAELDSRLAERGS